MKDTSRSVANHELNGLSEFSGYGFYVRDFSQECKCQGSFTFWCDDHSKHAHRVSTKMFDSFFSLLSLSLAVALSFYSIRPDPRSTIENQPKITRLKIATLILSMGIFRFLLKKTTTLERNSHTHMPTDSKHRFCFALYDVSSAFYI